ncbi:MAG TPA: hypothetical protein PLU30_12555 [Verrucomicrobiae bacterium]|nr:hypothetical protein [Verrucomicrobiae bacterium]
MGLPVVSQAGLPKHLTLTKRIASPPGGKALVNFHRPSNWGGIEKLAIFDRNGRMLIDLPGGSEFQLVCDPGEHVFIAWADHVTVVKADLAAEKTYDIMIDIGYGFVRGNIQLIPLHKGDARRGKLPEFERREKRVVALNRNEHVTEYEEKNRARMEDIKRDFFGGEKSDRVSELHRDDCR